eukprot:2458661-Amphidinium_carterae.1
MTCQDPERLSLMLKSDALESPPLVCPSPSVYSACCEGQQCTVVNAENHGDTFAALCFADGCFGVPQLASTYGDSLPSGDMLEIAWPTGTRTNIAGDMSEWCAETLSNDAFPVKHEGGTGELQYLAAVKKTHDNLTASEELQHASEVTAAKRSEWHKLLTLDCFRMMNKENQGPRNP